MRFDVVKPECSVVMRAADCSTVPLKFTVLCFISLAEPDAHDTGMLNAVSESCDEESNQDSGIKVRRTSVKRSKSVTPKYAGKGSTLVVKPQGKALTSMVNLLFCQFLFYKLP